MDRPTERTLGNTAFFSPLLLILTYSGWVVATRLLMLTLLTYSMVSPTSRFQDISDAFSSNQVSFMGLGAFSFIVLLYFLRPMTTFEGQDFISRNHIELDLFPGLISGIFMAASLVILFVLAGPYRNFGSLVQIKEGLLEFLNILLRIFAVGVFVYCEEYLFRQRLLLLLKSRLSPLITVNLVTLFYVWIKFLQFDLGIMHLVTLYLVSLALCCRSLNGRSFAYGAGIWGGILILFHPVLSLPIFGNEFSGLLWLKYQALAPLPRLLTGGQGGPLASLTFQILICLDILRSILKKK